MRKGIVVSRTGQNVHKVAEASKDGINDVVFGNGGDDGIRRGEMIQENVQQVHAANK